jgi:hypothetical protein
MHKIKIGRTCKNGFRFWKCIVLPIFEDAFGAPFPPTHSGAWLFDIIFDRCWYLPDASFHLLIVPFVF